MNFDRSLNLRPSSIRLSTIHVESSIKMLFSAAVIAVIAASVKSCIVIGLEVHIKYYTTVPLTHISCRDRSCFLE